MLLKVPAVLQEKYGLPATAASRPIPRIITRFRGLAPRNARKGCKACQRAGTADTCTHTQERVQIANAHKFNFFTTSLALMMSGRIPWEGRNHSFQSKARKQDELAAMLGISRETFTRRLSSIANADVSWTDDRRRRAADRERQRAQASGKSVREDAGRRHYALPGEQNVIERSRDFLAPNRYSFASHLPQRTSDWWIYEKVADSSREGFHLRFAKAKYWSKSRAEEECNKLNRAAGEDRYIVQERELPKGEYHAPSIDQLLADPERGWMWDAEAIDGYKDVPEWVLDHKLPLSDTARAVLVLYIMQGLLDEWKTNGKVTKSAGELRIRQDKAAEMIGIDPRTLYEANCELEQIGLIKVIAREGAKQLDDGSWRSQAQKIVFVPAEQAYRESIRLKAERGLLEQALHRIQDARTRARIASLASELFEAWAGSGKPISTFWTELRRILLADGIAASVCDSILPSPPQ